MLQFNSRPDRKLADFCHSESNLIKIPSLQNIIFKGFLGYDLEEKFVGSITAWQY